MLPVLTFSGLISQMAAGLQGASAQLIDLTVGSVLRAILESCASVVLWLQWLILQVLSTTRAATSVGAALDSWMADFSFYRLPGAAASGVVTFARYTTGMQTVIPVGSVVLTSDGTQSFAVTADATNPAWNGTNGYLLAAALASVTVPVQCTTVGPAGNVQAGTIGLLASPIVGVDTVTNATALAGGLGAESDAAFRARFQLYINSLSLATATAILNAVQAVQLGLRTAIIENVDGNLDPRPGSFLVVVDNGTGSPGTALLSAAQGAVDAVRPVGSIFAVQGPAITNVTVTVILETANAITHAAVAASAQQNVVAWIQGIGIAGTLAVSKIEAICHATDPSVISVTSTLINGTAQDVTAPMNGVILAASVTVS
jgi:phage-related baseplate assembly protein